MANMATIAGTMFPGTIVPIRLSHSGAVMSSVSLAKRPLNLPASRLSLGLLLLAGCAATQEEKKAALDTWSECIMRAVARLDDGKSDPASVAYGIAPQCAAMYQQFTETMVGGAVTENAQAYMRSETQAQEIRLITSAVLTYRAASPAGKRALSQGAPTR
jgi:hypothetical protein